MDDIVKIFGANKVYALMNELKNAHIRTRNIARAFEEGTSLSYEVKLPFTQFILQTQF